MVSDSIKEEHTSCSGFISFHSNKVGDWIKDLIELDLDNDKTVYKVGYIIYKYIEMSQIFQDHNWDFEEDYLENDSSETYNCYTIQEKKDLRIYKT